LEDATAASRESSTYILYSSTNRKKRFYVLVL
jgi:hypothetical protein